MKFLRAHQKLKDIEALMFKYMAANEYYDNLIQCAFVPIPPVAKKLIDQIGKEVIQIINE